jgi:hypothetical protein
MPVSMPMPNALIITAVDDEKQGNPPAALCSTGYSFAINKISRKRTRR